MLVVGVSGIMVFLFLKAPAKHSQTREISTGEPTAILLEPSQAVPQVFPVTTNTVIANPFKSDDLASVVQSQNDASEFEAQIQEQIDRLVDLQFNHDDASLQAILNELTNSNPIIRHEAIEATIQFGGHRSVPVLRDLAARTVDPDEQKELLEAAEFLALPTLSEVKDQR